jgi:hypothetical protein
MLFLKKQNSKIWTIFPWLKNSPKKSNFLSFLAKFEGAFLLALGSLSIDHVYVIVCIDVVS